jgi:hypothetical protein
MNNGLFSRTAPTLCREATVFPPPDSRFYSPGGPTAGVTGKRGDLAAKKLTDAESAIGAATLKVRAKAPHLSGARGVSPLFDCGIITYYFHYSNFNFS